MIEVADFLVMPLHVRLSPNVAPQSHRFDDDGPTTVEGKRIGLVGEALDSSPDEDEPVRPGVAGTTQS
jgi:hypothetical protein